MKIRETFENRKKNGQKALVTYIVSGDYGYETTKENIRWYNTKGNLSDGKRIKRRDQRNTICHDDVSQYDLSFWNRKIL